MKLAHITAGLLALGAIGLVAGPSSAAVNPNKPKILLHVKAVTTKTPCGITALANICDNANTRGDLYAAVGSYHMQLIVDLGDSLAAALVNDPLNGVAGVQFGINYPEGAAGISIFGWTLCATLEFASPAPLAWPVSGSGNLITWNAVTACQRNRLSCAGFFYLGAYGPGSFRLIKRPADNIAKVADCASLEIVVPESALGIAAFSSGAVTEGCNPCLVDCAPVAVAPTTWSKVKTLLN